MTESGSRKDPPGLPHHYNSLIGKEDVISCIYEDHMSIASGWKKGLSIERRDNSKGYSPENCRWVPMSEQAQNTSQNIFVDYRGEIVCLAEAVRRSGTHINYDMVRIRYVDGGWDLEKSLFEPNHGRRGKGGKE